MSSEVHRPSRLDNLKKIAKKYASFIGPGIMISVAYMDPGNYSTGVSAGANNRYSLLFFVLLSNFMAIFLQSLCIKLGTVTGYDLARCCREYLPRKINLVMWFLAECAIIATDVAEVIGSAIALNILLRIPLPAGVVITIVDVLVVLAAYRADRPSARFIRFFEYAVALLVIGVVACFAALLAYLPAGSAPVGTVFRGFVPSKEMTEHGGLGIATSIIGATVMIHSLFLGSGIVQPRLREYDLSRGSLASVVEKHSAEKGAEKDEVDEKVIEKVIEDYKPSLAAIRYCYKYSVIELVVTLMTFAVFVNAAIVIVAGGSLYGTAEAADADLYAIHDLLSKTLAPVAGTIFMLALLLSGQSAGIVCTIAGQMVSEGHLNWTCKPWIRRLVTRGIAIVPCFAVSISIGRTALSAALNVSQVIISLLLPPLMMPLIYFTCSKKIMRVEKERGVVVAETADSTVLEVDGEDTSSDSENGKEYEQMENSLLTKILLVVVWLFVSGLNIYSIYSIAQSGIYSA